MQPEDPDKAEDVSAAGDVKNSHPSQILSNRAGSTLECGTVTIEELGGCATVAYSTRNLRASKPAKNTLAPKRKCV